MEGTATVHKSKAGHQIPFRNRLTIDILGALRDLGIKARKVNERLSLNRCPVCKAKTKHKPYLTKGGSLKCQAHRTLMFRDWSTRAGLDPRMYFSGGKVAARRQLIDRVINRLSTTRSLNAQGKVFVLNIVSLTLCRGETSCVFSADTGARRLGVSVRQYWNIVKPTREFVIVGKKKVESGKLCNRYTFDPEKFLKVTEGPDEDVGVYPPAINCTHYPVLTLREEEKTIQGSLLSEETEPPLVVVKEQSSLSLPTSKELETPPPTEPPPTSLEKEKRRRQLFEVWNENFPHRQMNELPRTEKIDELLDSDIDLELFVKLLVGSYWDGKKNSAWKPMLTVGVWDVIRKRNPQHRQYMSYEESQRKMREQKAQEERNERRKQALERKGDELRAQLTPNEREQWENVLDPFKPPPHPDPIVEITNKYNYERIAKLVPLELGARVVLWHPNPFDKRILEDKHKTRLQDELKRVLKHPVELEIVAEQKLWEAMPLETHEPTYPNP